MHPKSAFLDISGSDERIEEVSKELRIEHESSIIVWSFGEDGEDDHKLKNSIGIAINADGEFIYLQILST